MRILWGNYGAFIFKLSYIQQDANFGEIDFLPARPPSQRENLTAYTRDQFNSARHSLQLLAEACERNDSSLKRVVAFGGISHLAGPLARRLGFDTYPLDQTFLPYYRRTGKVIRRLNIGFRNANSNFKDPQCAVITREKLVSLYGKHQ